MHLLVAYQSMIEIDSAGSSLNNKLSRCELGFLARRQRLRVHQGVDVNVSNEGVGCIVGARAQDDGRVEPV
jgi:hypothetical protein